MRKFAIKNSVARELLPMEITEFNKLTPVVGIPIVACEDGRVWPQKSADMIIVEEVANG